MKRLLSLGYAAVVLLVLVFVLSAPVFAQSVVTEVDSFMLPRVTSMSVDLACMDIGKNTTPMVPARYANRMISVRMPILLHEYRCSSVRLFMRGKGTGWVDAVGTVDIPLESAIVVPIGARLVFDYTDPNLTIQAILSQVSKMAQPAELAGYLVCDDPAKCVPEPPVVKKSGTGICHDESSGWFDRLVNFLGFGSMDECLDSGGRLRN